jgi:hypothetical protein
MSKRRGIVGHQQAHRHCRRRDDALARPSSTIVALAKVSASSISGAKCAASYQPGHIELVIPSISSEPNAQHTAANRTRLCQPRHVVGHDDHLWNSFHIVGNSARASGRDLLPTS